MTKIGKKAATALLCGRSMAEGNTTVEVFVDNEGVRHARLYLFGNWIADLSHTAGEYEEYTLIVRNASWHTPTTYGRLNDLFRVAGIPLTIGRHNWQVYLYQYTSDTSAYLPSNGFKAIIRRNEYGASVDTAGEYSSQSTCLWAFEKGAIPALPRPQYQIVP